jgi:hypothetical protein
VDLRSLSSPRLYQAACHPQKGHSQLARSLSASSSTAVLSNAGRLSASENGTIFHPSFFNRASILCFRVCHSLSCDIFDSELSSATAALTRQSAFDRYMRRRPGLHVRRANRGQGPAGARCLILLSVASPKASFISRLTLESTYRQNAPSEWMLPEPVPAVKRSDASDLARYPKMTESLVRQPE